MIVNIRVEVTDEQRNVLAVRNNGGVKTKRLATRAEFNAAVLAHVAELVAPAPVNADLARARVGSEEICAPEAVQDATAYRHPMEDAPPAPPERSDTEHSRGDVEHIIDPIDLADGPSPLGRALRSINNVMFSLSNAARRQGPDGYADQLENLLAITGDLRADMVAEFEQEHRA